ncbi:transmembrane protein 54a isoform X2 [Oncorhynchus mykiss]|uniref:transmembrane protein 54a isoform X2 n=1 Tax=Oncorhynchus mykiss TaxID=8022 RepID=UPI0018789566|nr:transmembrane protein 54a isoform X2 [Oncorhynchus mykiss]
MGNLGVCCADLKDNKTLMKMGLGLVLVGHVNFLLGALVHGVVLRHINVHVQARVMGYAIYIIIALVAGLVGIIAGIVAIVLSKNLKNRILMWALLVVSLVSGLLAIASTVGLTISMVKAIMSGGRGLLKNCKFPDAIGYSSVNECPFDPTRIYWCSQAAVLLSAPPFSASVRAEDEGRLSMAEGCAFRLQVKCYRCRLLLSQKLSQSRQSNMNC